MCRVSLDVDWFMNSWEKMFSSIPVIYIYKRTYCGMTQLPSDIFYCTSKSEISISEIGFWVVKKNIQIKKLSEYLTSHS